MATVDPDVLQAQYFLAELEFVADTLVDQIDTLDKRIGGQRESERRRTEFHEVRRQIDAIRKRFAEQI